MVLQDCSRGVTEVLHKYYRSVAGVLQGCDKGFAGMWVLKSVTTHGGE